MLSLSLSLDSLPLSHPFLKAGKENPCFSPKAPLYFSHLYSLYDMMITTTTIGDLR
ncbi:hypothetical protein Hanom_Chr00s000005g01611581 [Helianthus anomalus]